MNKCTAPSCFALVIITETIPSASNSDSFRHQTTRNIHHPYYIRMRSPARPKRSDPWCTYQRVPLLMTPVDADHHIKGVRTRGSNASPSERQVHILGELVRFRRTRVLPQCEAWVQRDSGAGWCQDLKGGWAGMGREFLSPPVACY